MEWWASAFVVQRHATTATSRSVRPFITASTLAQAPIHGLDKHGGCPRTGIRAVQPVVVHRRLRRLHLWQRHAAANHILDAVANDGHHVPVVRDVARVTEPSMARNAQRAALRPALG